MLAVIREYLNQIFHMFSTQRVPSPGSREVSQTSVVKLSYQLVVVKGPIYNGSHPLQVFYTILVAQVPALLSLALMAKGNEQDGERERQSACPR